jgi:hypothetical protein
MAFRYALILHRRLSVHPSLKRYSCEGVIVAREFILFGGATSSQHGLRGICTPEALRWVQVCNVGPSLLTDNRGRGGFVESCADHWFKYLGLNKTPSIPRNLSDKPNNCIKYFCTFIQHIPDGQKHLYINCLNPNRTLTGSSLRSLSAEKTRHQSGRYTRPTIEKAINIHLKSKLMSHPL